MRFSFSDGEIAEAREFTRDRGALALPRSDWSVRRSQKLLLPGSISIAA